MCLAGCTTLTVSRRDDVVVTVMCSAGCTTLTVSRRDDVVVTVMCVAGCTTLTVSRRPSTLALCSHVTRQQSTAARRHCELRSSVCRHWWSVNVISDCTGQTSDWV